MTTNELVAIRLAEVDPSYYQDQEEGYTILEPGLPDVACFHNKNGSIWFDSLSILSKVDHLRQWPPQEGADAT